MAEVVEINTLEDLQAYRLTWIALLGATERASFFHTFDWLETYWRHFGKGQQLRVLVVRAADQPIGIVPLCVKTETRQFGRVRVLTYPLDGWGVNYSPVGGCQAATLTMAMRHLAETPRDWDMIDLPWVDDQLSDRGRTARAMEAAGFRCVKREEEINSSIDTRQDWEAYLANRCAKTRQDIRRMLRRWDNDDQVEYVRHRPAPYVDGDGDPAWSLYEECEEVARNSWQADSTTGNTLCHERYRPFLRDAHAAAARCGMLDLNLLRIGGQAVAFNYNYHTSGAVFGLRTGYRKDTPNRGVGAALTMMTLRDSFARGDVRFELGAGNQEYKRRIRTHTAVSSRLTYTPLLSWRSQAVRLGRWVHARSPKPVASGDK